MSLQALYSGINYLLPSTAQLLKLCPYVKSRFVHMHDFFTVDPRWPFDIMPARREAVKYLKPRAKKKTGKHTLTKSKTLRGTDLTLKTRPFCLKFWCNWLNPATQGYIPALLPWKQHGHTNMDVAMYTTSLKWAEKKARRRRERVKGGGDRGGNKQREGVGGKEETKLHHVMDSQEKHKPC